MSEPPSYRYFAAPHTFSTYSAMARRCDLCGVERPGYGGPFAGGRRDEPRVRHVCEPCLRVGDLGQRDLCTNNADQRALREQLGSRHADDATDTVDGLVAERTAELERRTPPLVTWQPLLWPAHCNDYCRYVKEAGRPDLVLLAPDRDGRAFLAAHGDGIEDLDHASEIWEGIRPDVPSDNAVAYAVGVYLFQCLECGRYVILWDAN
jgi:uncharacterized protein CbrC (UPF0167 family)